MHFSSQLPCPCDGSLQHLTAAESVLETVTLSPTCELHLPGTPQAWVRRLVFSPPLGAEVVGRLVGDADGLWIGCDVGLNVVGFAEGDELGLDVTGEELGLAVTGDELGLDVTGEELGLSVVGFSVG